MTKTACHLVSVVVLSLSPLGCGPSVPLPLTTRAERTHYEQTTGYGEVVQFLERAAARSDRVHVTNFGSTAEGRPLPLAVVGDAADASPSSVIAIDRTRIWLQANIHGGEVCGKEALLMLLKDLVAGRHQDWHQSLTLLIAPIYNADGNERIETDNRPYQFGPLAGMGERSNAQGLDLNRDHMKLETPEASSLVRAYQAYDPHVVIDLHTTNGTQHAYHLTYAPPLHPNTHPLIDGFLRDVWLPTVTETIKTSDGWNFYYYGNLSPVGTEAGWYSFDHRPRFNNNYVGLRNRVAILGEAYAYAPFEERVAATLRFVEESLNFAHTQAGQIATLVESADRDSVVGRRLATRAAPHRSTQQVEILLGQTEELQNPYSRAPIRRRLDVIEPTMLYEYGTFTALEGDTEIAPASYYVPADLTSVVNLLTAHGVEFEPLVRDTNLLVEEFLVATSSLANRPFEGHRERTVQGRWAPTDRTVTAGTLVIPVSQPLGRLVFALLEPRSDDGIVNWRRLDDRVDTGSVYPILRRREPL